jgi:endonuclease/exonuclease/phosphatase (EEP) superfamily protein YafD
VEIRALSWNLFHGRDAPPEPELRTWRSRLLRTTERGAAHAQVNRDLREQFGALIAAAEWDVALLQELPPRWAEALAKRCDADAHLVLTSRNVPLLGPAQGWIADLNPDLIASWEGGSNLTLARTIGGGRPAIVERRRHTLARRPERRAMAFTRLSCGTCVANLHASGDHRLAAREVEAAARVALAWADSSPLLLGGDLNVRPARSRDLFERLGALGFTPPTGPDSIDHLLGHGLDRVSPARPWPPADREVPDPTAPSGSQPLPIRLSDHAPVAATFAIPGAQSGVQ